MAGAGDAGDRRRPVPHHLLARSVAVAAAARPRGGGARLRRHRARGRRALRLCARTRRRRWPAPARPRQRAAPSSGDRDRRRARHSLALWNAHVERTLAAARTFKAGWPSPRVAARDPYALRGLVLIHVRRGRRRTRPTGSRTITERPRRARSGADSQRCVGSAKWLIYKTFVLLVRWKVQLDAITN